MLPEENKEKFGKQFLLKPCRISDGDPPVEYRTY
jgi:hypothetical protein